MPSPVRFNDPRQERIHRRLGLLGDGPQAYFRDTIRILDGESQLETSTHLVAHLLREIESALRHVLEPIVHHKAAKKHSGKKKGKASELAPSTAGDRAGTASDRGHRDEILQILSVLQIPQDGEIGQAWLTLSERSSGLAGRVHRRALDRPRPLTPDFRELWDQALAVLDGVLEQLESRYVDLHEVIDGMLVRAVPTTQDLEVLIQQLPNNVATRSYFFDNLKHPGWLQPLAEVGLFSEPPSATLPDERGFISWPWWSAAPYLVRIAAVPEQQQRVLDLALKIPHTDNPRTVITLLDIATQLPAEMGAQLVPNLVRGMTPWNVELASEKVGALVVRWPGEGQADAAVSILDGLLKAYGEMATSRPNDGMADYLLAETIKDHLPSVLSVAPSTTIDRLLDALERALQQEMHFVTPNKPEDYSSMWRPTIAKDGSYHRSELANLFVSAVRDAVVVHLGNSPSTSDVMRYVALLEGRGWNIFSRLAMHLVTTFPEQTRDRVNVWLLNREAFDHWSGDYVALLARGYRVLDPAGKTKVVDWITEGIDTSDWPIDEESKVSPEEQRRRMGVRWQLKRSSVIKNDLDSPSRLRVAKLTESSDGSVDAADDSDDDDETSWVGPTSPRSIAEFGDVDEIVDFLRDWTPRRGRREPSPEGMSRALSGAVSKEPSRFASEVMRFTTTHPTYVRGVIEGFRESLKTDQGFDWKPVVQVAGWVTQQAREPVGTREEGERDPGWSWTHRSVASLLRGGLDSETHRIPCELRGEVWTALEPIARSSPDLTEAPASRDDDADWFSVAISSAHGEALIAVIRYAVWVRECEEASGRTWPGLDGVPEAKALLEAMLDSAFEVSPAIASVYGEALRVLAYLDENWLKTQVGRIFPTAADHTSSKNAAWNAYLRYGNSWLEVLEFARPQYEDAIDGLAQGEAERPKLRDPEHKLISHVMQFFWNSNNSDARQLADRLFARGGQGIRAAALEFVGRSVVRWPRDVPADVFERLQSFFDANVDVDGASMTELATFGTWLVSDRFERQWALDRALRIQSRGVALESARQVADFAASKVAPNDPLAAVRLIDGLVENKKEPWSFVGASKPAALVLQTALGSGIPEVAAAARVVVSKLTARGYSEFKKLLDPEQKDGPA